MCRLNFHWLLLFIDYFDHVPVIAEGIRGVLVEVVLWKFCLDKWKGSPDFSQSCLSYIYTTQASKVIWARCHKIFFPITYYTLLKPVNHFENSSNNSDDNKQLLFCYYCNFEPEESVLFVRHLTNNIVPKCMCMMLANSSWSSKNLCTFQILNNKSHWVLTTG